MKKMIAEALSAVLIAGLVSGAAPINTYAEDHIITKDAAGDFLTDGTNAETTDTGETVLKGPENGGTETEGNAKAKSGSDGNPVTGVTGEPMEEGTNVGTGGMTGEPAKEEEEETPAPGGMTGESAKEEEEETPAPGGAAEEPAEEDTVSGDTDEDKDDESVLPAEEVGLQEGAIADNALPLAEHTHDGMTYQPWEGAESLPASGNWYLTRDVTLSNDGWSAPDGETNICLNGKTIALAEKSGENPVIRIGENAQFGLYDHVGDGKITGGQYGGIQNRGTFSMYGGVITGNRAAISGGGVINMGTFFMYGGEIRENSALHGGGVHTAGVFSMYGGMIDRNHGDNGSGVANYRTFEMHGGKITNNTDEGYYVEDSGHASGGGGVLNYINATFDIWDGEISGNIAYMGGGIHNVSGTVHMYGGNIINNHARGLGGGVENLGVFHMYDGRIAGNRSDKKGGGILNAKSFSMFGGEISGNAAAYSGGGIQSGVENDVISTITLGGDVRITDNKDDDGRQNNVALLFQYTLRPEMSTVITIDPNKPLSETASIGITIDTSAKLEGGSTIDVTYANGTDYGARFYSDIPDWIIKNGTDNAVLLYIPKPHIHEWSDTWDQNGTHHWHDCTVTGCPITDNADKDGYAEHTEDGGTITKQPTETEEGVRTYRCIICGYEMRTEPIDRLQPSHVHEWSDTWDQNGTHHWHDCTVTGCPITDNADKDGYAEHTEDGGTITKQPTETEEGVRAYRCIICGYEMRTEPIPATGTEGSPDDGKEDHKPEDNKPEDKPNNGGGETEPGNKGEDNGNHEGGENSGSAGAGDQNDGSQDAAEAPGSEVVTDTTSVDNGETVTVPELPAITVPEPSRDAEPKTADTTPIELYATLAMISGLTYLLLYFADHNGGMTEETKKELVSKWIKWAKQGRAIRRLIALAAIFVLLVYYHSIGRQDALEWKEIC